MMRLLQEDVAHPGPQRRGDIMSTQQTTTVHASPPIDIHLLDQIDRHVAEVRSWAADVVPGVRVPEGADAYEYLADATADLAGQQARQRDIMLYRHNLTLAVDAGNEEVVCREACPRCACWGLVWRRAGRRASCLNRLCVDRQGRPSSWTLAQLAEAAHGIDLLRRAT